KEVAPIAERIHRHDELVPESIIRRMGELGYFGMSVPEDYGGQGMGNLVMIVITEELSAASLAAAGSLITRPEILTKALLKGGTGGGVRHGKADATPGYRGMHSFTLGFESYFVPAENLIGETAGEGKGFYLQMGGFAAGRLQTGGRASGLAQAALEATATYASERRQFGRPIGDFQLTQHKLGRMATHLAAARQLTYAAARAMDRD